jgi:hypothetical protein
MPVPMLPPACPDTSRMPMLDRLIRSGLADTRNASRIVELEAELDAAKREAKLGEVLLAKIRARAESAENALADAEDKLAAQRARAEREFLKLTAECAEWKHQAEEAQRRVPGVVALSV